MGQAVILEQLYPEMEEATIGRWLVAEGDSVQEGQALAELITDKVAYEYSSPVTGIVSARLAAEKSVVPVGTALAVVGAADEPQLAAWRDGNRRLAEEREEKLRALQQATAGVSANAGTSRAAAVRATPAARRLARERGVDLSAITGSGPGGMITIDDIP